MRGINLLASLAIVILGTARSVQAVTYDFLPVASTGSLTSEFVSVHGNGTISVNHTFSAGGAGLQDNVNTAIFPSQFTTLFPGSGSTVQGHLAQTVYNHTSVVTFDLTQYALSSSTVFGIWNITDEVSPPQGGSAVYRVELIDSLGNPVAPATFNLIGNQDNQSQVAGRHKLLMNAAGDLSFGALLNAGGTHTDAAFWDSIPAGTKKINVYGNLPALNTVGDGVGYYFAEVVPEPGCLALMSLSGIALLRRRRCN